MKRTTALIAFTSAMALATAASAQLVGGAVGGATGQVGGAVSGATGSVTGSARSTTQGAVNPLPRTTPPASVTSPASATTGATVSGEAAAPTPPAVNAAGQIGATASTPPANANASAAAASTTATDLTFLKAGQTVRDASGATLGTISKIERGVDGAISNVLVTAADGKRKAMSLAPDSLSISGDVVTTTSASADKK